MHLEPFRELELARKTVMMTFGPPMKHHAIKNFESISA
jgi:hypothetical protein